MEAKEHFLPKSRPIVVRPKAAPQVTLRVSPLREALEDFLLSREAMRCSPATLVHYRFTAGAFVEWLERQGANNPCLLKTSHVREWLAADANRLKPSSLHARARGVRTFLKFLYQEHYIFEPLSFEMPRLESRRLPAYTRDQVGAILKACPTPRERALVLLLADCGIRRAECFQLTWGDLDFARGSLLIQRGKGGKSRTVFIGAVARRALLAYRRSLKEPPDKSTPMWTSKAGRPITIEGAKDIFQRLSARAGFKVTPHAFRRTFALQSLRSGMDLVSLQRLMGHCDVRMTSHYLAQLDDDLLREHQKHGLDSWL